MSIIHVAAAVIFGSDGRVFLAKRPMDKHQGGLWEFPGGKVEAGETALVALKRELLEEVGIDVTKATPLIKIPYHYPDKSVVLDVFSVTEFTGEPHGVEGQDTGWFTLAEFDGLSFPAANAPIVNAVRLPKTVFITPETDSNEQCIAAANTAVENGAELIVLRDNTQGLAELKMRYEALKAAMGSRTVVINSDVETAIDVKADGVHLNRHRLAELTVDELNTYRDRFSGWISASCHDEAELQKASECQLDWAFLSPVLPTASHPELHGIGWDTAAKWVGEAQLPVFLLGGLNAAHLSKAIESGAQGIAGISGWLTD
jgi:8-oxo-dGTP diphosphatase